MFVIVYEPSTNEVLLSRRMGPREIMDARKFADQIADDFETTISESDGYIPSCSGDIRVEFRPRRDDGTVIWSGESFFFERESY